jgi:DNA-binding transcriptional regulator YdaS (Cro superfamily)
LTAPYRFAYKKPMSDFHHHVRRAVELAGGQSALARKIGLSQPSVKYLCEEAKSLRAEIAVAIEEATEGKVTRSDLRPDIFPEGSA